MIEFSLPNSRKMAGFDAVRRKTVFRRWIVRIQNPSGNLQFLLFSGKLWHKARKALKQLSRNLGVLWIYLGRGVPLGLWYPYPFPDHVKLHLVTLFCTRFEKFLPYPRPVCLQELYFCHGRLIICQMIPYPGPKLPDFYTYPRLNCSKAYPSQRHIPI